MRHFMLSGCALTALFAAAGAHATSEDALSYTWTGLYGGVNVGYGWQNSDWDFGAGGSTSPTDHSGAVGLQVGYDAQVADGLFAGVEASLDASGLSGKSTCFTNETCEDHLSSFGDVSARVGVTSGRALYYLKGGVAYEDVTHHIESVSADRDDSGGAVLGYLVGGGAEYALSYNVTTKLEYNYMDFGSHDSTISPNTGISAKENISLVKLGFNFKFD